MCFIEFDWKQAEVWVNAVSSKDETMEAVLRDGSIHENTMKRLGCGKRTAKGVLFGSAYGAGPKKLRETLLLDGIETTELECKTLQRGLAQTYPTWWEWRYAYVEEVATRKYAKNVFGRIRRFPMGKKDAPAIMNFIPQSTVGDMAWTVFRPLWEEARKHQGRLTTSVYDSFLIQVPKEYVTSMIGNGMRILEQTFDEIAPGFSLPVSVSVGEPGASWAELKERQ